MRFYRGFLETGLLIWSDRPRQVAVLLDALVTLPPVEARLNISTQDSQFYETGRVTNDFPLAFRIAPEFSNALPAPRFLANLRQGANIFRFFSNPVEAPERLAPLSCRGPEMVFREIRIQEVVAPIPIEGKVKKISPQDSIDLAPLVPSPGIADRP